MFESSIVNNLMGRYLMRAHRQAMRLRMAPSERHVSSCFKLMPCHLTDTASFMVDSKNDDIIAYTPIAKNAWHMECNLWAKACKDMKHMYDYTRFGVANFMKIRVICGRYR